MPQIDISRSRRFRMILLHVLLHLLGLGALFGLEYAFQLTSATKILSVPDSPQKLTLDMHLLNLGPLSEVAELLELNEEECGGTGPQRANAFDTNAVISSWNNLFGFVVPGHIRSVNVSRGCLS